MDKIYKAKHESHVPTRLHLDFFLTIGTLVEMLHLTEIDGKCF